MRRRGASTARPQSISRREQPAGTPRRACYGVSAVLEEEKEAAGQQLSADEQVIANIVWIDVQVAPNGFDGWLYCTSNERMRQTLDALATVGCARVAMLVKAAMAIGEVDPAKMSDAQREAQLDTLSETARRRLGELDNEFYDAVEECMGCCRTFLNARGINVRR
jgi:hypothetical protein